MKPQEKRIIVGMSGGVDSSVAAFLLKESGFKVEGLFMKNWEESDTETNCSAAEDVKDAEHVCNQLKIPLHTVNFSQSYWDNVFTDFLKEFEAGRTPNPDILCNKEIKFKLFLKYALGLGADNIATGHYASIDFHSEKGYELHRALDPSKDQSYFLYTLSQEALSKTIFPLNKICKTEVRDIAKKAGFLNHQKKDSVGICFIGERKFSPFLQQYLKPKPGLIETEDGKVIGEHQGLMFYTIGQRQGLKIGGLAHAMNAPWFVAEKDLKRNTLVVVQGTNHPLLFKTQLNAENLHWINGHPSITSFECSAKIRYRQQDQLCTVKVISEQCCEVIFHQAQRAVTPGQSIVFYEGNRCLGGGVIT